jgi:hypothetical protein
VLDVASLNLSLARPRERGEWIAGRKWRKNWRKNWNFRRNRGRGYVKKRLPCPLRGQKGQLDVLFLGVSLGIFALKGVLVESRESPPRE